MHVEFGLGIDGWLLLGNLGWQTFKHWESMAFALGGLGIGRTWHWEDLALGGLGIGRIWHWEDLALGGHRIMALCMKWDSMGRMILKVSRASSIPKFEGVNMRG
jgi:hypothetical protein